MLYRKMICAAMCGLLLLGGSVIQTQAQELPDPDGKPADMAKPVQV